MSSELGIISSQCHGWGTSNRESRQWESSTLPMTQTHLFTSSEKYFTVHFSFQRSLYLQTTPIHCFI